MLSPAGPAGQAEAVVNGNPGLGDSCLAANPTPEPPGVCITAKHIWLSGIIHGIAHEALLQTTKNAPRSPPPIFPHHLPFVGEGWQHRSGPRKGPVPREVPRVGGGCRGWGGSIRKT